MLAVVQKTPAGGSGIVRHGGRVRRLIQVLCRRQHRAAVASSRDEQSAPEQQALRGCRPWAHILAVLETTTWEPVLSVGQGTTVSH
jgi:hypothetical protein